MLGTMEMPVNFGSNRLIPEFQLASIGWLDPVLRSFRGSCCLPSFSFLIYVIMHTRQNFLIFSRMPIILFFNKN